MVQARLASGALAGSLFLLGSLAPALGQSNPGYFVPTPHAAPRPPAHVRPAPRPRPRPRPEPMVQAPQPMQEPNQNLGSEEPQGPAMQLQLPPMPTLPTLAKGNAPPAAVIGVLGIPEIMRASTAAQHVEKVIGERRQKLNGDARKEQLVWQEMQQSLANERTKLNAEQIRGREKELQDRITNAQKTFRERDRVIQEAGQYGLAQIERVLVAVIRQVSESRGMNLVLHRAQVALNVNEYDITDQVIAQLNKTLPDVELPADGKHPPMIEAKPNAGAPASTVSAPGAAPTRAAPTGAAPATPAGAAPAAPSAGPASNTAPKQ